MILQPDDGSHIGPPVGCPRGVPVAYARSVSYDNMTHGHIFYAEKRTFYPDPTLIRQGGTGKFQKFSTVFATCAGT
jgi:hypothetical protein